MKFNSLFMQLCVLGEKVNLLAWAIRPVFPDPVTYVYAKHTFVSFFIDTHLQQQHATIVIHARDKRSNTTPTMIAACNRLIDTVS